MTFSVNITAGTKTDALSPVDTAKNAILTGTGSYGITLVSLRAMATTGSPTLDVWFYDNSKNKEAVLDGQKTLSTSTLTELDLTGLQLGRDDELRVQANSTAVDILLTYAVRGGGSGS